MSRAVRCVVCLGRFSAAIGGELCKACGESYDRAFDRGQTVMTSIEWAAKRARYFERERRRTSARREGSDG